MRTNCLKLHVTDVAVACRLSELLAHKEKTRERQRQRERETEREREGLIIHGYSCALNVPFC